MKQLRLANSIVTMMTKDRVHYPARLIVDTSNILVRCGILLVLYHYIFNTQGGSINGLTFQTAAWSIFLYFAFMNLRLRDVSSAIMQDVKSGTIEVLLSKPIHYVWYRVWWQLGAGLYSFCISIVFGTIILASTVGISPAMMHQSFITTLPIVIILGMVLSLLIYTIVGLCAFWIENVKPVYWIVDKTIMILGGSYLPVVLFPNILHQIAIWSPFGASQFITHTVYDTWESDYMYMIGIQAFWVAVLGLFTAYMFARAQKKTFVNGG